jgi:DNA-binding transcriptional MerR regulator
MNLVFLSISLSLYTDLPYKEKDIEKKYFSIGEVADMFKVAPSLIRFWESEFDTIQPQKNKKGNRQFTKEDIEQFRIIYSLVKEKGYTLAGAKELLKKDKQKVKNTTEILESLKKVRAFLVELKKQLDS